ncbi:MAG: hypothetical protein ABR576_14505 [Thermoanaerobaculia bacterium]
MKHNFHLASRKLRRVARLALAAFGLLAAPAYSIDQARVTAGVDAPRRATA